MSSLHQVAAATRRAGNNSAAVSAAPAHPFDNDTIIARRLLLQIGARLADGWRLICLWRQRSRDRATLRSLSSRDIRDFCPRQAEAEQEMSKPFWRA